ncbi:amidohydrolase [Cytobacillus oceanisediminis]|uniref:amidohydrolase n=1 Tax=Cytobacillus oceanisediminis TaxID=665099 RepID=UPI00203F6EE2|nr:amidohydrolase [Cytobacillus oceanisediminis]MCM3392767.1 amidohydrolase [Cytobacillus oceanisediminis]
MNNRLRNKLWFLIFILIPLMLILGACTEKSDVTAKKDTNSSDKKDVEASHDHASLVFKNGKVYTMEEDQPLAEAVAIKDGEIQFVGSSSDAEKYVGEDTEVIDLEGKMVSPGFMDGHTHPPGLWTSKLFEVYLAELESHEEYVQAVADFREKNPKAKIITGDGWVNGPYEQADGTNPGPKKEDLDAVVSDIPVMLYSIDKHSVWVNSKALEIAGITKDTVAPKGGMIERNPDGSPRGVLREGAMDLLADVQALSNLTDEQYKEAILEFQKEMHSFGMTGVMNMSGGDRSLKVLNELEKEGKLTMRVANAIVFGPETQPEEAVAKIQDAGKKYNSDWLSVNTVKLFADGVTEGKTALFVEPYTKNAGMGSHHHGDANWKEDTFNKMVSKLDKEDIQVHIHAIGDGAVKMGLDALELAKKENEEHNSRHTITHISAIQDSDISRMANLGVIASLQPFWFYKDQYYDLEKAMIGEKRALAMYPAREMWDAGVTIASSSDYPPTPDYRPLNAIETGATRNSPYPEEQDTDLVRNLDQALTVKEMLQSYTKNVAYQIYRENDLGSLKAGKKADMVVLGEDLTNIEPKNISETSIVYTIVDGKIVFKGE